MGAFGVLPPLHAASRDGDLGAVRSLLKRIDVMTRDAWGETPLHWSSTAKVAECLIAAGAKVRPICTSCAHLPQLHQKLFFRLGVCIMLCLAWSLE